MDTGKREEMYKKEEQYVYCYQVQKTCVYIPVSFFQIAVEKANFCLLYVKVKQPETI